MLWLKIKYGDFRDGYIYYNCPNCGCPQTAMNSASTHCTKCTKSLPDVIQLTEPIFTSYRLKWHQAAKGIHRIK